MHIVTMSLPASPKIVSLPAPGSIGGVVPSKAADDVVSEVPSQSVIARSL